MVHRPAANKLRAWRLRSRLTLGEISALTGISVPMLSLAERGQRQLSPMTKVLIARRLRVPLGDLFAVEKIQDEEVVA